MRGAVRVALLVTLTVCAVCIALAFLFVSVKAGRYVVVAIDTGIAAIFTASMLAVARAER